MDDLVERLDLIISLVEGARAMPLTASCVLNRAEMLEALEDLRARLPERLADADRILADSEAIIDDAHRRAASIVADGRRESVRLASGSAVVVQAESDAAAITAAARQAAEDMRRQIDSYVDGKLAGFEELLDRTLTSVTRGRERLASRSAASGAGGASAVGPAGPVGPVGSAGAFQSGPAPVTVGEAELYMSGDVGDHVGAGPLGGARMSPGGIDDTLASPGERWAGVPAARGGLTGHVRLTSGVGAPIG
ncbi:F0F1-type ATP synthase, beta subunit [Frankia sp. EI5c]|uniref:hypothetical protein n=1 Tax=Frankia sp. EI5c TaxID=683316 RepID=UPI0007C32900|nr:hypothetical protein [Frankia sp. EI5c]OAA20895.1 F0F1-type ATP synthase, beta subunit [Frankia sp. EI5c]OAA22063.1 F0F1-type ATP synthase, beta subunit [Frankia sp. EI5c]